MPIDRILFIDAYDSFSNSIIALLSHQLSISVESIKIDDPRFILNDEAFYRFLDGFSAVVAGPGPGHPAQTQDVGLIGKLWNLPEQHILPVLGICLGFQSLAISHGASIRKLSRGLHGMIREIDRCPDGLAAGNIFAGVADFKATLYHSLCIDIGQQRVIPRLWRSEPGLIISYYQMCVKYTVQTEFSRDLHCRCSVQLQSVQRQKRRENHYQHIQ